ncbi:hypothetical protein QR680_013901 [Steinernema hermaphroditum]|uniref:G-protein coupled receptors family 1 profile domain-containing protein n=1 Tax=Steinernema hermaphroditum TaxID=289476 RepID=A0AA39I9N8_9BILA|nr:hypothetical protein QR680_013901 [Steinernema hermaphroditum]
MGNSQFIFNAYGFLILGIFLILFNLPVLIVVVCAKKLRNQYGVVIMSLVNGFLSGMTGIAYGVFRLALFGQGRENDMVSLAECMYNPLTFFLLWTFPMIGIGLFINSIDRLLVISFPLSYFNYNTRVVVVLNIVALVVNAGIVFVAVYGTLNGSQAGKMINIFCSHNDLFTVEMFILLASIRCFFATMSVLLMFVVLVLFMKQNKITTKLAFHTEESIQKFKARQMNYTKTMLLSCIATIVLFLIPALFAIVARAGFVNTAAMEVQYYINSYGFLILGILLVLFNLPVVVVVCHSKKLRNQYGVLIISLLNGLLSGLVSAGYGIFRLVLFAIGRDDEMITVEQCFYNPLSFFYLWTFPMMGLGLLLNSVDRLLVISFPLSYFRFNAKVVLLLNIIALVVNSGIVFIATYFTIHTRSMIRVDVFCNQNEVYSENIYIFLAVIRTIFASLAVFLMVIVLIIFVKQNRIRMKRAFHTDDTIKRFRMRQMNYTKTMLISCIATIGLYIIPSIVNVLERFLHMSDHTATWMRFISFFNSFNIAILLIYRQQDIRWRLCRIVNCLFRRKLLNVSTIESTNADMSRAAAPYTQTRTTTIRRPS